MLLATVLPISKYYFEFEYNTVTTCIDAYIPAGGGTPGGGSGGGTIPNPGGGYDPCIGNALRTSTNPCNPNPQNPVPVVAPNATVVPLVSVASANGVSFTSTEIGVLNTLGSTMINRIKNLIATHKEKVKTDYDNLIGTLTGRNLQPSEIQVLDGLADNIEGFKFLMRLMYVANAYGAQNFAGSNYNSFGATCATCKANAFKHALFLIFNAETFTKNSAEILATAHEAGQAGLDTQMDIKNNAAGSAIFTQFNGFGTELQWADRVKKATNVGEKGLVFIKNSTLTSTKEVDPTCP